MRKRRCGLPRWSSSGDTVGELQYETDRARFLGRGHHVRTAVSMIDGRPLSNTVGSVLDPVMSLRRTVRVPLADRAHRVFDHCRPARDQVWISPTSTGPESV